MLMSEECNGCSLSSSMQCVLVFQYEEHVTTRSIADSQTPCSDFQFSSDPGFSIVPRYLLPRSLQNHCVLKSRIAQCPK